MANPARKIVEVQESTWTQASGKIIAGLIILAVGVALVYMTKFLNGSFVRVLQIVFALVAFSGFALVAAAVYSGVHARKLPGVGYECPYCERVNQFEAEPTESFDCDHCNRTVHFDGGVAVPVRMVNCPFCHTDHRVAINVHRYVCDRCNRPLELATQAPGARPSGAALESVSPSTTYDVLLIATDRRHEIEVAMKLQNILVVNLPEARRLMASASTNTPLVVGHALPQRKAEAIRRQLQDVGATATLRAANEATPPVTKA